MNIYKWRLQEKEEASGLFKTQGRSGNNAVWTPESISIGLYLVMVILIHRLYMGMDRQRQWAQEEVEDVVRSMVAWWQAIVKKLLSKKAAEYMIYEYIGRCLDDQVST